MENARCGLLKRGSGIRTEYARRLSGAIAGNGVVVPIGRADHGGVNGRQQQRHSMVTMPVQPLRGSIFGRDITQFVAEHHRLVPDQPERKLGLTTTISQCLLSAGVVTDAGSQIES